MSHFETINTIKLVRTRPSLRQTLDRWIAAAHHKAVVARLRRFREKLESDMAPEPWTALEAPMVLLLSDVCNALGLSEKEKAGVMGAEGLLALTDTLEGSVRPVFRPRLPMNERQVKAVAYAREHGTITMHIYRKICPHWSDETLRLDLNNLVKRGLLDKNGQRKGTRYTLAA